VDATVSLPGSKSLTNRVLVLSALASGPSRVHRPLVARDTTLMADGLRALGTGITADVAGDGTQSWLIEPHPMSGPARIDCGLAGTVMRFLPVTATLADGPAHFDGDPRARERPMAQTLGSLRALGASVTSVTGRDTLPFTVHGAGSVHGGTVRLDASGSSQFVSALMLAGARFDAGVDIRHEGKPVPSSPHLAMTIAELRRRGVDVDDAEPNRWVVQPGAIHPLSCDIEPDLSNAAPFLAAALATGGTVRVPGWPQHTEQAGDELRSLLAGMGATVHRDDSGLTVSAGPAIEPISVDLHDVGELTPVIAALCALATGTSVLSGIAHLRGHETDRLAAIAAEINGLGGQVSELDDGLRIEPRPLRPGRWRTYADHRMAHAGAVLGLAVPGTEVEDVATTAKTFPGFAAAWHRMLQ
jgi:3-phosphoshikimate 1-carboxyvinyltransferase